jgi:flagellar protein FliS
MNYSQGAGAYHHARVLASSKEQVVVLLYEHLLANLRRAGLQIQRRDIEGKAASLERASDIVFELMASLDLEAGGEIASRLSARYGYFIGEINAVGRSLDQERLDRLAGLVSTLHQSWAQAAQTVAAGMEVT